MGGGRPGPPASARGNERWRRARIRWAFIARRPNSSDQQSLECGDRTFQRALEKASLEDAVSAFWSLRGAVCAAGVGEEAGVGQCGSERVAVRMLRVGRGDGHTFPFPIFPRASSQPLWGQAQRQRVEEGIRWRLLGTQQQRRLRLGLSRDGGGVAGSVRSACLDAALDTPPCMEGGEGGCARERAMRAPRFCAAQGLLAPPAQPGCTKCHSAWPDLVHERIEKKSERYGKGTGAGLVGPGGVVGRPRSAWRDRASAALRPLLTSRLVGWYGVARDHTRWRSL
eukprot:96320-Chlamydomonas_euryale.AAC.6